MVACVDSQENESVLAGRLPEGHRVGFPIYNFSGDARVRDIRISESKTPPLLFLLLRRNLRILSGR